VKEGALLRKHSPLIFQIKLCRTWHQLAIHRATVPVDDLVAEASQGRSLRLSG